jgi:alpha-L-fucosidase 2
MAAGLCAATDHQPVAVDSSLRLPPASCNLRLATPVVHWFDGIPLGNGQLGALIWGREDQVEIKLDRLDIWTECYPPDFAAENFTYKKMATSVAAHRASQKSDVPMEKARGHDALFSGSWAPPTHLPIGKLKITLPKESRASFYTLDLGRAEAGIEFQTGRPARAIACATAPVVIVRFPGKLAGMDLWAPGVDPKWPTKWAFAAPVFGQDQTARWYEQSVPEGTNPGYGGSNKESAWKFVVFAQQQIVGDDTLLLLTITSSKSDGDDPLMAARARVNRALATGWEALAAEHSASWVRFWSSSALHVPDEAVLRHYYIARYYLGASSAPGFPAMAALQSIWTDDKFPVPSFRNGLHNDLETQVQYQSYQAAGDFAVGRVFLEYVWELMPTWRGFAQSFYETGGAAMPSVMSLAGNPTGGWPQYQLSPTYAGWFGWLFYQHWRYTQDREFLETRAYPWCAAIAECWSQLLKPDEKGILKLPLSSSAEVFNDSLRAWMKPNTTQDIDLMQAHLLGLAEMADVLGKGAEVARWRDLAGKLGPRHVDEDNALMWSEDEKVTFIHRHLSHLMSIQPFNLLTVEGSERDRQIIAATMARQDQLGVDVNFKNGQIPSAWWWSASFPWMASVRARVGQPESAYMHLDLFLKNALLGRNGFHLNRWAPDGKNASLQKNKKYLFTTEGNMLAQQALHDMLIQSWAPSIGLGEAGIVRLFPATPWSWHEASFTDLRAEGGFRVSARREKKDTVWFKIVAEAEGLLRLRDNFDSRTPKWKGAEMTKVGRNFACQMRKGEVVEATLELPKDVLPKPKNVYVPANSAIWPIIAE